jgi:hypothetical protein
MRPISRTLWVKTMNEVKILPFWCDSDGKSKIFHETAPVFSQPASERQLLSGIPP